MADRTRLRAYLVTELKADATQRASTKCYLIVSFERVDIGVETGTVNISALYTEVSGEVYEASVLVLVMVR
jgi:hypothetical protein